MSRQEELILSGLLLTEPDPKPASGHWFKHLGNNWNPGAAEPSNSVRPTLALDGDDERTDRFGNRTYEFDVAICGYTAGDIADGERELAQVANGVSGVLEWLPPTSGPRTLYEVRTSRLAVADLDDIAAFVDAEKYLVYRVTLRCLPWAYPETTITETFTPGTPTITTIDTCGTNTNWPGTTAVTYLSQSAVRVQATAMWLSGIGYYPTSYGVATSLTYSNGSSPSSGNYMYLDFAYALSGFGQANPPMLLLGGNLKSPLASQLQADGYMRYFWARVAGPLTFRLEASGMASGDTASFYVDEFGTANVLPSGSLMSLTTKGSVRTEARLRISHPSTNGLGETLIYADPTMLDYGWNPSTFSSLASAPDGTYWIYVQPTNSYAVGDVFSLTVAGQTVTTRTEHTQSGSHWIPMGPFQFGGRKSRRLGALTGISASSGAPVVALLKNGVGTGFTSVAARLFRQADDAALVHAWLTSDPPYQSFWIEPACIDIPEPGMFVGTNSTGSDAVSAMSLIKSWGFPRLVPPTTALWVECGNTASPSVTVTHRPPFHTLAAEF